MVDVMSGGFWTVAHCLQHQMGVRTKTMVKNDDPEVHNLVRKRNQKELEKIAKQGGLERVNKAGQTALFVAVQDRDLCEFLLRLGANVNHADNDGRTPLSLAVANGDKEVCQLLIPHVDKFLWRDATFAEVGYVGVDEIGRWQCVKEKKDAASFFLMSGKLPVVKNQEEAVTLCATCKFTDDNPTDFVCAKSPSGLMSLVMRESLPCQTKIRYEGQGRYTIRSCVLRRNLDNLFYHGALSFREFILRWLLLVFLLAALAHGAGQLQTASPEAEKIDVQSGNNQSSVAASAQEALLKLGDRITETVDKFNYGDFETIQAGIFTLCVALILWRLIAFMEVLVTTIKALIEMLATKLIAIIEMMASPLKERVILAGCLFVLFLPLLSGLSVDLLVFYAIFGAVLWSMSYINVPVAILMLAR